MNPDSTRIDFDPAPVIRDDPRKQPAFQPSLFPTANGSVTFPSSADPKNEAIVLAFLSAYYELNVRWTVLRGVRAELPPRPELERAALEAIETALLQRDELEDYFAPLGIIAEPIAEDGITRDVLFTFGSVTATGNFRSQPFTTSAELSFAPPKPRNRIVPPPGPPPAGAISAFPCAE